MDYDELVSFIQHHFTDGLVLVIGSGLSVAEGIPGMTDLASYLDTRAGILTGDDALLWGKIKTVLDNNEGLEAALLKVKPSITLENWIAQKTCDFLIPKEHEVIRSVLQGKISLRLTSYLDKILKPPNGLPIVTPNYDRLIEVACEMSGFHVDTTAIGQYAGSFDHTKSCMGSCRGIITRSKTTVLDHFPRAIVLKPHGSFDWYKVGNDARRCSIDIDAERLIITPGLNKYRAGYDAPFDKHRDLANDYIKKSNHLMVVGYGFNDDHLQNHLIKKIKDGTPTLILNRFMNKKVEGVLEDSPNCICLSEMSASTGVTVATRGYKFEHAGENIWDLGILTKEILT